MKIQELLQEIKLAALATLALLIILCGLYPLVVWGIAQAAFPGQANGSLVRINRADRRQQPTGPELQRGRRTSTRGLRRRVTPASTAPVPAAATWGPCPRSSAIR